MLYILVQSLVDGKRLDGLSWIESPPDCGGTDWSVPGPKLHAVVRAGTASGPSVPHLAERITLTPASAEPQSPALGLVEEMVTENRIEILIADRGYTFAKAERWADPLRELGVDTVFDLHPDQRSTKGTFAGALLLDGSLYCPSLPEALKEIERLDQFATVEERKEFFAEIERRRIWEMRDHGKPHPVSPDG